MAVNFHSITPRTHVVLIAHIYRVIIYFIICCKWHAEECGSQSMNVQMKFTIFKIEMFLSTDSTTAFYISFYCILSFQFLIQLNKS